MSQIWYSVDPGVSYYAWARWSGPALHSVGVCLIGMHLLYQRLLVIEKPVNQSRGQGRKIKSQLLPDLAWSAGRVADRFDRVEALPYSAWAGQLKAPQVKKRVYKALTDAELECLAGVNKKDLAHVVDAIGIGLYWLKLTGERT